MEPRKTRRLTVTLSPDEREALGIIAEAHLAPVNSVIRQAIQDYIAKWKRAQPRKVSA